MPRPVSDIPNLGPASEEGYARAGIHSAEELIAMGADEAYLRLMRAGARPHFIGYYALVMGLQGRPWNDCRGKEKTELRKRFDSLKRAIGKDDKGRLRLEAALDEIGLLPRQ
ncbi:MAG: TfoX/Sxy family protein [Albidovulum sp.]